MMSEILGIVYDLDGTFVETQLLQVQSWQDTCEKYNVTFTDEMARYQKGRSSEDAIKFILKDHPKIDKMKFKKFRRDRVRELFNKRKDLIKVFPGAFETCSQLDEMGYPSGICTTSAMDLVDKIYLADNRFERFSGKTLTGAKKPDPFSLWSVMRAIGADSGIYIGDAESDYLTATQLDGPRFRVRFVYFHALGEEREPNIPSTVHTISHHAELIDYL
jgi:phosphoglycolate phosphatase-like HAD superfamily hydrolase